MQPDTEPRSKMKMILVSFGRAFTSVFRGWGHGYGRLAESHAASVAGDALVAVALAGTLFFSVPSTDARSNVALYLILTLAPFALLGPLLAKVFDRSPGAYRAGLALSSIGRAAVAAGFVFVIDSLWLFPLAFLMLVLSRFHGISRSSVLPVVVRNTDELIDANARLARAGVIAAATVLYVVATVSATHLPPVTGVAHAPSGRRRRFRLPRDIRLARFATAGVRFLNGYLVLLIAFSLRDGEASVASLAALLGAAGLGYFLSAWAAPTIGRHVREEPMVVGALAIEAMAAFIGAQMLSLAAAAVLVGAAGFAWGTAKFAFDGMMHRTVPEEHRARAFTTSETMFQIAWVVGALIPVLPFWPTELGLSSAGVVALVIQVGYVSLVLLPERHDAPVVIDVRDQPSAMSDVESRRDRPGVLDLI